MLNCVTKPQDLPFTCNMYIKKKGQQRTKEFSTVRTSCIYEPKSSPGKELKTYITTC